MTTRSRRTPRSGSFTRIALAVRRRMERPGRYFCTVRRDEDGAIEVVRRVGRVDVSVGIVRPDLTLEPKAVISTGGLIEERRQLRELLGELRGEAAA